MARNGKTNGSAPAPTSEGITRISVAGFKSIRDEQSIEIRPLTILAGANSSGKSSIMQPLLLMKQTLEASYDPGALLLNGPNAQFSFENELFSWRINKAGVKHFDPVFHAGMDVRGLQYDIQFTSSANVPFETKQFTIQRGDKRLDFKPNSESRTLAAQLEEFEGTAISLRSGTELTVMRDRWMLEIGLTASLEQNGLPFTAPAFSSHLVFPINEHIRRLIHVPGIRGDVKKPYPVTAVDRNFPGVFDPYIGAMIDSWQRNYDPQIALLLDDMNSLKLITTIEARKVNDVSIELFVNRLPNASRDTEDKVNITQVGLSIPVTLSAVTALHAAKPNTAVYIEQPELHLHPRAQVAMATILANAALRGVRVVVETHSSLLLRGVQTLVAEGKLDPKLVALHWFSRDDEGNTKVDSADLTRAGAFGKWPQDFGDVDIEAQGRYLDAAGLQLLRGA